MEITIGTNIKNLRTKKQITQKQLATYLGVTEQAVSRWENGAGYPDIQILPAIASYFSVTTDEILGLYSDERQHRLAEIRRKIKELNECGNDTEEDLENARIWAAEFPGEEDIVLNLADQICRFTMWNENPKMGLLKEAEKFYLTLIETTTDAEIRNCTIEKLTALYAVGFHDVHRAEETADKLPTMKYSRESVKASVFSCWARENNDKAYLVYAQDYIKKLVSSLGNFMTQYVIQDIPNNAERWDEKIEYFQKIIDLYSLVFGKNMLFYHGYAAYLWRVIATYKVAQDKYDETLDCLEKMTYHALLADKAQPGEQFTSPFMDLQSYPDPTDDFDDLIVHNNAYYCRMKLDQERYDSIRQTKRFDHICLKLEESMR